MKQGNVIIKNSTVSFVCQTLTLLFTFVTRSFFLKYIGVELLGLNGTVASIISTLSLAELGFYSAVAYNLYRPLHDGNEAEVNDVLNILRIVYRVIGVFFIIASIAVLPFLRFLISDIEVTSEIYLYFLLQATASTCTYFLAYKRTLLYADQKEYVSKSIDALFNAIISILQCVTAALWKNYAVYLVLKIIQTYVSNVAVHLFCKRNYPYLRSGKLNRELFKRIWRDVKNVFTAKIAGYIYSSTDNIVISALVSTISVGFLTNYTTVISGLRNLTLSLLSPLVPVIGRYLVDKQSANAREKSFLLYSHIRFIIAALIVGPTVVLIDSFICLWVGTKMLLDQSIVALLCADFYITIVHGSTLDFINADGLFRQERNIEVVGAVTNIVISIILARHLGIQGVLFGTIVSQVVFWVGRSLVTYRYSLKTSKLHYAYYWIRNLVYACVFICGIMCSRFMAGFVVFSNEVIRFIVTGVVAEAVMLVLIFVVFWNCPEQKLLASLVNRHILHRE